MNLFSIHLSFICIPQIPVDSPIPLNTKGGVTGRTANLTDCCWNTFPFANFTIFMTIWHSSWDPSRALKWYEEAYVLLAFWSVCLRGDCKGVFVLCSHIIGNAYAFNLHLIYPKLCHFMTPWESDLSIFYSQSIAFGRNTKKQNKKKHVFRLL